MNNGYRLRLADGHQFHITADESVQNLVDWFAGILELEPTKNSSSCINIHYVKYQHLDLNSEEYDCTNIRWCRFWRNRKTDDQIVELNLQKDPDSNIVAMWNSLRTIYWHQQKSGGLPLHSTLVELDGNGYVLAAAGNTGKSTCARRIPPPWRALCDDEVLIVKTINDNYQAHAFPTWSDYLFKRPNPKTWNVESHVPLKGIFFLEQDESDTVSTIGTGQATISLSKSAESVSIRGGTGLLPDEKRYHNEKLFDNSRNLIFSIPAFKLKVSLTGRFWEKMEAVL